MFELLAQRSFRWEDLIYLAVLVLGGIGAWIRQWAAKKHEGTVDAEIEDEPAPRRPVARPPSTSRAAPPQAQPRPVQRPAAPVYPAHPQRPTRPAVPPAPARAHPAQPSVYRPPAPTRPVPARQPVRRQPSPQPVPVYEPPAPARAIAQPPRVEPAVPSEGDAIKRIAHDPAKLRHAIILNEILSPPLALRTPGESPLGPSF